MRTRTVLVLMAATAVAAQTSTALGGPSLTLASLSKREASHYKSLDRRIRATVLLATNDRIQTDVVTTPMTAGSNGYYSGYATCGFGKELVGGGVGWNAPTLYLNWHVIESAPDLGGTRWVASVAAGGSPAPTIAPSAYAVCASVG
jgi:hypothetical protein